MFSGQNKSRVTHNEPKKRSLLGTLFVPDIGRSISPIGESFAMFTRLIAMIFAANGLFPKNHPALLNVPGARLTLSEIVSTGWQGVSFTREGLPKALLFFAVAGCLSLSALAAITILFSLMLGSAHAADQAMFDPVDAQSDLALGWLGYMFEGNAPNTTVTATSASGAITSGPLGLPQSQIIQTALRAALGFYSKMILVFAGFILLYHLVVMIAETAHTGTPMGKNANQIWAPIRLAFAIALLLPIGGELNVGQHVMIQMAKWGSNFASQTWSLFTTTIANQGWNLVEPNVKDSSRAIKDYLLIAACQRAYNIEINGPKPSGATTGWENISCTATGSTANSDDYTCGVKTGTGAPKAMCGSYSIPKTFKDPTAVAGSFLTFSGSTDQGKAIKQAIYDGYSGAFSALNSDSNFQQAVQIVDQYLPDPPANTPTTLPENKTVWQAIAAYHNKVAAGMRNSVTNSGTSDAQLKTLAQQSAAYGWVAAGAWFQTIARTQTNALEAAEEAMPHVIPPTEDALRDAGPTGNTVADALFGKVTGKDKNGNYVHQEGAFADGHFSQWLEQGGLNINPEIEALGYSASTAKYTDNKILTLMMNAVSVVSQNVCTNTGGTNCDRTNTTTIGLITTKLGQNPNPLGIVATIGHESIALAFNAVQYLMENAANSNFWKGMLSPVSKLRSNEIAGYVAAFTNGALGMGILFGSALFTAGIMLGFALPLLPFTLFFFNMLSWFLSVCEAVVSMPLLALAHLSPKGDGLPGDMARQGYHYIFAIFLRPVLMVIGLIFGLLIFFIAVSFLTKLFSVAAASIGGFNDHGNYDKLGGYILGLFYSTMIYISANSCFKAISFFPDHAMAWMGSRGPQTEKMGDKQLMGQATQFASAYGFDKALSGTVGQNPFAYNSLSGASKQDQSNVITNPNVANMSKAMLPGEKSAIAEGRSSGLESEAFDIIEKAQNTATNAMGPGPKKATAPPPAPKQCADGKMHLPQSVFSDSDQQAISNSAKSGKKETLGQLSDQLSFDANKYIKGQQGLGQVGAGQIAFDNPPPAKAEVAKDSPKPKDASKAEGTAAPSIQVTNDTPW